MCTKVWCSLSTNEEVICSTSCPTKTNLQNNHQTLSGRPTHTCSRTHIPCRLWNKLCKKKYIPAEYTPTIDHAKQSAHNWWSSSLTNFLTQTNQQTNQFYDDHSYIWTSNFVWRGCKGNCLFILSSTYCI